MKKKKNFNLLDDFEIVDIGFIKGGVENCPPKDGTCWCVPTPATRPGDSCGVVDFCCCPGGSGGEAHDGCCSIYDNDGDNDNSCCNGG